MEFVPPEGRKLPYALREKLIVARAARRHNMISTEELVDFGLSTSSISKRVAASRLHPQHRGVFSITPNVTRKGRWMAATLATEGPAAHQSAGAIWDLCDDDPDQVHVIAGGKDRDGIKVHHQRLLPGETTKRWEIPVTRPARTLIDLAESLPQRAVERALDEAEYRHRIREGELERAIERHATRTGAKRLAKLLDHHTPGSTRTISWLEEYFLALLDANDLPRPVFNRPDEAFVLDAVYEDVKLIIELDGRDAHTTRQAFQRDRRRDADLQLRGYRVIRFTWLDLTRDLPYVLATLRAAMGASR